MAYVVKAFLVREDGKLTEEIRRFTVDLTALVSYQDLYQKVAEKFQCLNDKKFLLQWKDTEGDVVTFTTDEELKDALSSMVDNTMKIYVKEINVEVEMNKTKTEKKEKKEKSQSDEFNPPPQLRRWMRRFMRRWHEKMSEHGGDPCPRLLDREIVSMGAKGGNGTESSEESGLSGGEQTENSKDIDGVTTEKCKELKARGAEKRQKVYVRMLRKSDENKNVERIHVHIPETDSSSKSEGKKKCVRILLTPDENSDNVSKPDASPKLGKKNRKGKEDNGENSDIVSKPDASPKLGKKNRKGKEENGEKDVTLLKLDASPKMGKKNRKGKEETEEKDVTLLKPDASPKMGKKNRKEKGETENSEEEPLESQHSPLIRKKCKHVKFGKAKKDKTEEGGWTVLDEDCDVTKTKDEEPILIEELSSSEIKDLKIQTSLNKMLKWGFSNEGDWLERLLMAKDGDIVKTVETIRRNKKLAKALKHCACKE
ncbi:hypothetical protein ScPMuIL_002684 [Solemya velum]